MLSPLERQARIDRSVNAIREMADAAPLDRSLLERVRSELIDLASDPTLFPDSFFPPPHGEVEGMFLLSEDPDHRYALYLNTKTGDLDTPPHNHTTWAVVVGVAGEEHNRFFQRTDNRAVEGVGTVAQSHEFTVVPGTGVCLLPEDLHSIHMRGAGPNKHLHMYGLSLEHLPTRTAYNMEAGTYKSFGTPPKLRVAPVALSPAELKALLNDGEELALLDLRELGAHAASHLLLASCLPLSKLEMRIADLVPRRATRIVLVDDDGGELVAAAVLKLVELGYRNLYKLEGGTRAWAAAGYELFQGANVPSKAFGEHVEHACHTPSISAQELKAKQDAGTDLVILDSRTLAEYRNWSIPGGIPVPGAELLYRVHDVVTRPDTLVVVNCAGRTRSIIGAQTLRNAGLANEVVALRNGTMGWELAGLTCAHGAGADLPAVSAAGRAKAQGLAAAVAKRFGVARLDAGGLAAWRAEAAWRSLYLIDVRTEGEYLDGHLAGAINVAGGQLVQTVEAVVGTRNARVVLIDDDGVRATMTASWLLQMGWGEAVVLALDGLDLPLEAGRPAPRILGLDKLVEVEAVTPAEAKARLGAGRCLLLDFAGSPAYAKGHIAGAWFAVRARLAEALMALPAADQYLTTSPDGVLARFAAADLMALTGKPVAAIEGGTEAWTAASLALTAADPKHASKTDDVWLPPVDQGGDREKAFQAYLDWELALVAQLERDGDLRFKSF